MLQLYDIASQTTIREFVPKLSNHYQNNRAAMHPRGDLLLTDGVLFDIRNGREVSHNKILKYIISFCLQLFLNNINNSF